MQYQSVVSIRSFTFARSKFPNFLSLLLGTTLLCFLHMHGYAQTVPRGGEQKLRAIKFGETVTDSFAPRAVHGYRLLMEAGTSVVCQLGQRETAVSMSVVVPEKAFAVPGDKVPDSIYVGRINTSLRGLVEPIVVIADKTGPYVIRMIASPGGKYSINCGDPHPTTERDRKFDHGQKLFLEIRQALDAGQSMRSLAEKLKERVRVYREIGDDTALALALVDEGFLYTEESDLVGMEASFRESQALFSKLNSHDDVSSVLQNFAAVYENKGHYQLATDYAYKRLEFCRIVGRKDLEANAAFSLAILYHRLADEAKAREYYDQSFAYNRSIDPPTFLSLDRQVLHFTNLANLTRGMNGGEIPVYGFAPRTAGDYRTALKYIEQALELNRQIESLFGRPASLHTFNLLQAANCHKELGQHREAIAFLDRFDAHPNSKSQRARARVAVQYGSVYARMGEIRRADEYFDEVVKLLRGGANPGNHLGYLLNIARDYHEAGELQKAQTVLLEATTVAKINGAPLDTAQTIFSIARVERDLGNFNIARLKVEEAIEIAEDVRATIRADELRTIYFSTVSRFYEFYVDLLMQAHKSQPEKGLDRLALETSEKARSRHLLDLLTIAGVNISQGADPALLEKERFLRQKLSDKAAQLHQLPRSEADDKTAAELRRLIADLSGQYDGLLAEIRAKNPQYAALTQPSSFKTHQIQELLDSGTLILEYSLGEKKSYFWVISSTSVRSFDLPPKAEIEAKARAVYAAATARNVHPKSEPIATRNRRLRDKDTEFEVASSDLSDILLGPAELLLRNKRLLIVADGALGYIPFAALPRPGNGSQLADQSPRPLGLEHEIVTLPSASVLGRLRKEFADRKPASQQLAVFADPVFSRLDNRARTGSSFRSKEKLPNNFAMTRDFERAIENSGLADNINGGLSRLLFSRREANSIIGVSPKGRVLKRLDFAANKKSVFETELDRYRIIHFATHGLLDSQNPGLSGIVLSLLDDEGNSVDGFLRLHDIYNLKLNADLVVLSACNTALGKEVRGEGLIGLTRGFMYAGAPRVVASLWKVDDAATAYLMSVFYRKMLADNLRPAAALRAAQIEMMKQPRWRSPYYWAPFVLQGEWK